MKKALFIVVFCLAILAETVGGFYWLCIMSKMYALIAISIIATLMYTTIYLVSWVMNKYL